MEHSEFVPLMHQAEAAPIPTNVSGGVSPEPTGESFLQRHKLVLIIVAVVVVAIIVVIFTVYSRKKPQNAKSKALVPEGMQSLQRINRQEAETLSNMRRGGGSASANATVREEASETTAFTAPEPPKASAAEQVGDSVDELIAEINEVSSSSETNEPTETNESEGEK